MASCNISKIQSEMNKDIIKKRLLEKLKKANFTDDQSEIVWNLLKDSIEIQIQNKKRKKKPHKKG